MPKTPGRKSAPGRAWCSSTRASSTREWASRGTSTGGWQRCLKGTASARSTRPSAVVPRSSRPHEFETGGGGRPMTTDTAGAVSAKEKLIVALDVETAAEALRLFGELREEAGMFKVGSQLYTAAGPDLVRRLVGDGARLFLDLKFHDIPNTVAAAAREAVRLGVALFNVHAAGGTELMRRASDATAEEAARLGVEKPSLIAVTVLTSMDADAVSETGVAAASVEEQVRRLAR